jgi:hypothetical protein
MGGAVVLLGELTGAVVVWAGLLLGEELGAALDGEAVMVTGARVAARTRGGGALGDGRNDEDGRCSQLRDGAVPDCAPEWARTEPAGHFAPGAGQSETVAGRPSATEPLDSITACGAWLPASADPKAAAAASRHRAPTPAATGTRLQGFL